MMSNRQLGKEIFRRWMEAPIPRPRDHNDFRASKHATLGAAARAVMAEQSRGLSESAKQEITIRLDASDAIAQIDAAVAQFNAAALPLPMPTPGGDGLPPVARVWMERAERAERRLADIRAECERIMRLHEGDGATQKSSWMTGTHNAAGLIARAAGFSVVIADHRSKFRVEDSI